MFTLDNVSKTRLYSDINDRLPCLIPVVKIHAVFPHKMLPFVLENRYTDIHRYTHT